MEFRKIRHLSLGYVQVTLPARFVRELGWELGEPIAFEKIDNSLLLTPVASIRQDR